MHSKCDTEKRTIASKLLSDEALEKPKMKWRNIRVDYDPAGARGRTVSSAARLYIGIWMHTSLNECSKRWSIETKYCPTDTTRRFAPSREDRSNPPTAE
jgi:hypothetical protein